jgi:hypothetical protein
MSKFAENFSSPTIEKVPEETKTQFDIFKQNV